MIKLIERELNAWSVELSYYTFFLNRAELTEEQRQKIKGFRYVISGIIRELEEMKNTIQELKNEKKYQVVKLYCKEFNNDGEISYGFFTTWPLIVFNEENLGPQVKFVKILFNKDNIDPLKYIKGGTLLVETTKMTKPPIYKIGENGQKPYIWIDEIEDFVEGD